MSTIALKLTSVASFYRYCEQEELLARTPMACVAGEPGESGRAPGLPGSGTRPRVLDPIEVTASLGGLRTLPEGGRGHRRPGPPRPAGMGVMTVLAVEPELVPGGA